MRLTILFLLFPILTIAQNHYWEHGVKKHSADINSNTFYLTLINETIEDSIKNRLADQELYRLLDTYNFSIKHEGFTEDRIGSVYFRKLTFKHPLRQHKKLKALYKKIYSYDKVQFFGPLIYNFNTQYYGAGLHSTLDITFKPDTDQSVIDALVKKYNLVIRNTFNQGKEKTRKVVNGTQYSTYEKITTISVLCSNTYGIELLRLSDKLQNEASVDRLLNHLFIQATF